MKKEFYLLEICTTEEESGSERTEFRLRPIHDPETKNERVEPDDSRQSLGFGVMVAAQELRRLPAELEKIRDIRWGVVFRSAAHYLRKAHHS